MKNIFMKGVIVSIFCSLFLFGAFTDNQVGKDEKLTIVATVTVAKPELKDEVLKAIQAVVDATRKETGCISYNVFEDVTNPLKFVFIENWKSQAAIDSHNNSPHFKAFVKAIDGKTTLEATRLKQKF